MAWTNLSYALGSLLTSTKMAQLYDNLGALAAGLSGAPTITTTAIGSGTISSFNIGDGAVTATEVKSNVLRGFQHLVNSVTYEVSTVGDGASLVFSAGLFSVYTASSSKGAPAEPMEHQWLDVNSANWVTQSHHLSTWVMVWSNGQDFRVENNNGSPRAVLFRKL